VTVDMTLGSVSFTALTTASVDALPLRVTVSRTPRAVGPHDVGLRHEAVVHGRDVFHV
jgi:hypothetical protein